MNSLSFKKSDFIIKAKPCSKLSTHLTMNQTLTLLQTILKCWPLITQTLKIWEQD